MDARCRQQDKGVKDDADPEPQVEEQGAELSKGQQWLWMRLDEQK